MEEDHYGLGDDKAEEGHDYIMRYMSATIIMVDKGVMFLLRPFERKQTRKSYATKQKIHFLVP